MASIPDILRKRAEEYPENIAIKIDGKDEEITYKNLNSLSSKISNLLLKEGLKPQGKVSVAMTNADGIYYCASYFGIQKAGGVFVPVNVRYSREEMVKQLEHSESSFLISSDELMENWGDINTNNLITLKLSELKSLIENLDDKDIQIPIGENDTAEIIYTSGTTGVPKGVEVKHGSITAFDETPWLPLFAGKTFLHPVPVYTFAGMTYIVFPIRMAMRIVLMQKFEPKRFVELLEKEKVFSVYAVSSMWLLVLKEVQDLKNRDFSNLFFLQFGAAPMPPSAVIQLCEIFPTANIINLYGLTESGSTGCMIPPGEAKNRPTSVGKPLPPTEVKIVDDSGNSLPPGEIGEICLRGPSSQLRSYYKDSKSTDEVWTKDGWVKTGDLGYLDAEGFLYLVDRKKDIINRGGYKISSLEVEDAIYQHPAVKEVSVVGIPHPVLTEDIVAFVVPKTELTEEELKNFLQKKLADYKVPRRYYFLNELPKNPLGKVLKKDLRKLVT